MQIQDGNTVDIFQNYTGNVPMPRFAHDVFDTNLEQRVAQFACYKGRESRRREGLLYSIGVLCDITEMATIDGEAIDEKESVAMGKMKYKSNRGHKFTSSFKVNGDAIYGLAAVLGYDFSNVADSFYSNLAPSIMNIKGDHGILGCLFIQSASKNRRLRSSIVLTQCRLIVPQTAGSTDSFTVSIESEGEHMQSGNGQMFVFENFVDNGTTITNANAPDGTRTVFKVGDGNESLLGATTGVSTGLPVQVVRTGRAGGVPYVDVADPYFWFVEIAVDGVPLQTDEVLSFDYETGELELVAPPADGACLSLTYCLPTGYPDFSTKMRYFVNDMVKYLTDYYRCTTTHKGVWNAANFTLVPATTHFMGAEFRPHNFGVGVGDEFDPTYPTCMFNSWHLLNLRM